MASIKGLELKNVKKFVGHEGECYQGNLYLNGKKIGFWSEDQWGGADTFFFEPGLGINQMKFNRIVEETFPPVRYLESEFSYDLEYLMADILSLKEREKSFKKQESKVFPILVVTEMKDGLEYWSYHRDKPSLEIESEERERIESEKKRNDINRICIYRTLDDFNIGEPFKLEDIAA